MQMLTEIVEGRGSETLVTMFDRHLGKVGVAGLDAFWDAIAPETKEGMEFGQFCELVGRFPGYEVHDGLWCWRRGVTGPSYKGPLAKMLAVAGELSLEDLYNGFERHFRFHGSRGKGGWRTELLPLDVFCVYLRSRDDFVVTDEGMVSLSVPIDPETIFESTDRGLVDILTHAPDGEIGREEFLEAWEARGLNQATLRTMMCYSPLLKPIRRGYWTLRGSSDLPELLGGWARSRARSQEVHEVIGNGHRCLLVSMTVPERLAWTEMPLPDNMLQDWDGTRYDLTLPACGVGYVLEVTDAPECPDLAGLLQALGAVRGMVLQLRVDLEARTGMAEVMTLEEYRALIG